MKLTRSDFHLLHEALDILASDYDQDGVAGRDRMLKAINKIESKLFKLQEEMHGPVVEDDDDRVAGYSLTTGEPIYR